MTSDPNEALWAQVRDGNDAMLRDGVDELVAAERLSSHLASAEATDYRETGEVTMYGDLVTLSTLARSESTVVMAATFEPGGRLHPHDHEGFVGAMKILSGDFLVQTFEIAAGSRRPDGDPTRLRPVDTLSLSAGDVVTITPDDGHVHQVTAGPDGGAFVDAYFMTQNPGSCRFFEATSEPDDEGAFAVTAAFDAPIH